MHKGRAQATRRAAACLYNSGYMAILQLLHGGRLCAVPRQCLRQLAGLQELLAMYIHGHSVCTHKAAMSDWLATHYTDCCTTSLAAVAQHRLSVVCLQLTSRARLPACLSVIQVSDAAWAGWPATKRSRAQVSGCNETPCQRLFVLAAGAPASRQPTSAMVSLFQGTRLRVERLKGLPKQTKTSWRSKTGSESSQMAYGVFKQSGTT